MESEVNPETKKKAEVVKMVEVWPETARNLERQAKLDAEEFAKRQLEEQTKKKLEMQEAERAKELAEAERRKQKEAKQKIEEEKKRKEDEEARSKVEGKLEIMINSLYENKSPLEYSLAGIKLGSIRCRILNTACDKNTTLRHLHLSRKGITDEDGIEIAKMLKVNNYIQKVELEGNFLKANAAKALAEALKINKTIRVLDLEGNYLTDDNMDKSGVIELANALKINRTLLELNLANNHLLSECGDALIQALEVNTKIISIDITFNHTTSDKGLTLDQVRQIRMLLTRNKELYDAERLREWRERKLMHEEDILQKKLRTIEEEKELASQAKKEEKDKREKERELNWVNMLKELEIKKNIMMQRLDECAKLRKTKRPKRRKGKKKKK